MTKQCDCQEDFEQEISQMGEKLFITLMKILDLVAKILKSEELGHLHARFKELFDSMMEQIEALDLKFLYVMKVLLKKSKILFFLKNVKEAAICLNEA